MACGDRYAHLAVTASGLNLDNPTGLIPSIDDVLEWRERARELGLLASSMLDELAEYGPPWSAWNAANEQRNSGVDRYQEIPTLVSVAPTDDVGIALASIAHYLCAMELAAAGIEARFGEVPEVPGVTPTPDPGLELPSFAGLGVVVVAGGVGWMLLRRMRR